MLQKYLIPLCNSPTLSTTHPTGQHEDKY